jgi:signal transduction histidine kinase/ActR/RegA family two-component response regulator
VLEGRDAVDREVAGVNGRWYLARVSPNRAGGDSIEGVVLTLIDITERKRVEDELRESDRRKDEFLALLAHELRNPLAPITSGIDVLKVAGDNPRIVAQVSATMERQTHQLVRLVDDLLDVSRLTGGRLRLRKAKIALADVLRDALAVVRPLVERSRHELVLDLPAEPVMLDGDDARLTQVFANLLNNAARYTPPGGRIELTARAERGFIEVKVKDNGSGIAQDQLGHVFEMFFQGADPRLARNAGLGIGLTLAKSLVELHGGAIVVESDGIDRGSTFTVRLPAAQRAEPVRADGDAPPADFASGRRVLIVDDNVDAAQTLRMVMEQLGDNEIHTARSGAEALETAAAVRPDVVLLDLKMPEMDGFEVARRIRASPWGKDILLVALTGWTQDEHKRRSKEAGFDRHLTKPADQATLRAVLCEPRLGATGLA